MNNRKAGGGGVIVGIVVVVIAIASLFVSHEKAPNLFKLLLWVVIIVAALVIALIVLIIFLARRSSKKDAENKKNSNTSINKGNLTAEQAEIINKGRSDLVAVRMVSSRIKEPGIRNAMIGVNSTAEKILTTLREKPEEIQSARQFTNYYLPTLRNLLEKFQRIEASQVDPEDFASKLTSFLADVQKALDKQYTKLFAGDKFDMSVDMKAMTIAIRRDGLLDEDEIFHMAESEPIITPEPAAEPELVAESEPPVVPAPDFEPVPAPEPISGPSSESAEVETIVIPESMVEVIDAPENPDNADKN